MKDFQNLKDYLENQFELYNQPDFIPNDPISIPHLFSKKQDIEIAGLFAAILAWGNRTTIIKKCKELLSLMDDSPYDFILHHKEQDLKPFEKFKHRTFTPTDALYFLHFLNRFYQKNESLEIAFTQNFSRQEKNTAKAIGDFHTVFFEWEDAPARTRKHVATPERNSACKRLNMYLRWMVRKDDKGVDFGIWDKIGMNQLICPCDVHVERVARKLGLIQRKQMDWKTAVELTENLKKFDNQDPVKYDFALFGAGVIRQL